MLSGYFNYMKINLGILRVTKILIIFEISSKKNSLIINFMITKKMRIIKYMFYSCL